MQRGYTGPADSHLPEREPLRQTDIDMAVVKMMTGFEFGEPRDIERKLRDVLESESYKRAVDLWERRRVAKASSTWGRAGESPSSSTTAFNSMQSLRDLGYESPASPTKKNTGSRRFSGFDFYRKKLFSPGSSPPTTPRSKSPPGSSPYGVPLGTQGAGEGGQREPSDPTKGFHPLISIYFLCKEKIERERIYGPTFASSQISLNALQAQHQAANAAADIPAPPPSAYKPAPVTKSIPQPIQVPPGVQRAEYNNNLTVHVPRVPVPEATHFSGTSYDAPVSASPNAGATVHPQPRARATDIPEQPTTPTPLHTTNYGTAPPSSLSPTAPAPAKHRRSHSFGTRPTVPRGWDSPSPGSPAAGNKPSTVQEGDGEGEPPEGSKTAGPTSATFAERERERYRAEAEPRWTEQVHREEVPGHPHQQHTREGSTLRSKFGSLLRKDGGLGRRSSVLRGARPSTDVGTVVAKEEEKDREKENIPPSTNANATKKEREKEREREIIDSGAQTDVEGGPRLTLSASQPIGQAHRRAATILDPMGRPGRHERRSSMGAGLGFPFVGTLGRRPKTSAATTEDPTPSAATAAAAAAMAEGNEKEGQKSESDGNGTERERDERTSSEEATVKPIYLKGLFRCAQFSPDGRLFLTRLVL